jgi:hypothetical protein
VCNRERERERDLSKKERERIERKIKRGKERY